MLENLGVQHDWVLTVMLARNMDCGRLWEGGGVPKNPIPHSLVNITHLWLKAWMDCFPSVQKL